MEDKTELTEIILKKLNEIHKLGEHAGGSGHLSYRSLSKLDLKKPKHIDIEGIRAFEVKISYKIYTESEFEYDPDEDDYLTESYNKKITYDEELNILDITDI